MKTEWNYTGLATAYLKRPDYSQQAIDQMLEIADVKSGDPVCDVGAGVAHLTLMLADKQLNVVSVEPNDDMRTNGIKRTASYNNVKWFEGVGEDTGQPSDTFKLVTFGSSFNVCDRPKALEEVKRISQSKGWFACMWNHRNLSDPIQTKIESIIASNIEGYGYGTRREDQTEVIDQSGLFGEVKQFSGEIVHMQDIADVVEAWRSHATLERQAGDKFHQIVNQIEEYLNSLETSAIKVPYTTNIWMAQLKD